MLHKDTSLSSKAHFHSLLLFGFIGYPSLDETFHVTSTYITSQTTGQSTTSPLSTTQLLFSDITEPTTVTHATEISTQLTDSETVTHPLTSETYWTLFLTVAAATSENYDSSLISSTDSITTFTDYTTVWPTPIDIAKNQQATILTSLHFANTNTDATQGNSTNISYSTNNYVGNTDFSLTDTTMTLASTFAQGKEPLFEFTTEADPYHLPVSSFGTTDPSTVTIPVDIYTSEIPSTTGIQVGFEATVQTESTSVPFISEYLTIKERETIEMISTTEESTLPTTAESSTSRTSLTLTVEIPATTLVTDLSFATDLSVNINTDTHVTLETDTTVSMVEHKPSTTTEMSSTPEMSIVTTETASTLEMEFPITDTSASVLVIVPSYSPTNLPLEATSLMFTSLEPSLPEIETTKHTSETKTETLGDATSKETSMTNGLTTEEHYSANTEPTTILHDPIPSHFDTATAKITSEVPPSSANQATVFTTDFQTTVPSTSATTTVHPTTVSSPVKVTSNTTTSTTTDGVTMRTTTKKPKTTSTTSRTFIPISPIRRLGNKSYVTTPMYAEVSPFLPFFINF
ncbi:hypothetical protein SK128_003526 [Halocaridina rubra]|uniref:Uncharacterized protein n=1 Tax=Halocaridina rubra TaxID=373956 RepID=A0AAN8X8S4_HALRR